MTTAMAERLLLLVDQLKPLVIELKPLIWELEEFVEHPFDRAAIEALELNERAYNALKRDGVKTVGEARARTDNELLRTPNFGRKSLAELREALKRHDKGPT